MKLRIQNNTIEGYNEEPDAFIAWEKQESIRKKQEKEEDLERRQSRKGIRRKLRKREKP